MLALVRFVKGLPQKHEERKALQCGRAERRKGRIGILVLHQKTREVKEEADPQDETAPEKEV